MDPKAYVAQLFSPSGELEKGAAQDPTRLEGPPVNGSHPFGGDQLLRLGGANSHEVCPDWINWNFEESYHVLE
jgi:hypothetical protein